MFEQLLLDHRTTVAAAKMQLQKSDVFRPQPFWAMPASDWSVPDRAGPAGPLTCLAFWVIHLFWVIQPLGSLQIVFVPSLSVPLTGRHGIQTRADGTSWDPKDFKWGSED